MLNLLQVLMMDIVNVVYRVERNLWFSGLIFNVFISEVASKNCASAKNEAGSTRTSGRQEVANYLLITCKGQGDGVGGGTTESRGFMTVVQT